MTPQGSVLSVEGDSVVVTVEVRSIGAHENITDNNVVKAFWYCHSHDAHKALSLTTGCNLDNVVLVSKNVLLIVNFEGDIGKQVNFFTSLVNLDTCNDGVNDLVRSNNEGSTGVNSSFDPGGFGGTVRSSDLNQVQVPVGLLNNIMGSLESVSLSFEAGNGHVGLLWVVEKVETERLVFKVGLHEPGWQVID